jgi:ribosomal protein L11 methyltransferase
LISVVLFVPQAVRDEVIADLWETGTTGITEEADFLRAFFEDDTDVGAIEARFNAYNPQISAEEDRDWVAESQAYWEPFTVGERFYLVPEWRDDAPPSGRMRLTTYPGMACGTGIHPATQLCLMAMERHLHESDSVLDIGTGSGILAQAALLLGARRVLACDIEPDAAAIAHANFEKTGAPIGVFAGSLRSVKSGAVTLAVANLNPATLSQIASDLKRISERAIVSGFREDEIDRVKRSFAVEVIDVLTMHDWGCLVTAG